MSGLINISRIVNETSEHCGTNVSLDISVNLNELSFSFEWHSSPGMHSLEYSISNFEIKMISADINDVVIGFFKSRVDKTKAAI